MEIWELNQLSRSEIEKMRDDVKNASAKLDYARQNLVEGSVSLLYPNAKLLLYVENILREYSGDDLHPKKLPDNIVFYLWLCFGSLVDEESCFNYTEYREERMSIVGDLIIRASFLQEKSVLDRVKEYYGLLRVETDKRGFSRFAR